MSKTEAEVSSQEDSIARIQTSMNKEIKGSQIRKVSLKKNWWKIIGRGVYRTIKGTVIGAVTFVSLNVGLLQFSFYQTFLIKRFFRTISGKIIFDIEISQAYLNIFNSDLVLKGVNIYDPVQQKMIYAERIFVDFDYQKSFLNGDILLQKVILDNTDLSLVVGEKNKKLNFNQLISEIQSLLPKKEKKKSSEPVRFVIEEGTLIDCYFSYSDSTKATSEEKFDPSYFSLNRLNAEVEDLLVIGDTVQLNISELEGEEKKAGLAIKKFDVFFRLTDQSIELRDLELLANKTYLNDQLILSFNSMKDMGDFLEKVNIQAHLDSSIIYTDDLAIFSSRLDPFKTAFKVRGDFNGTVSDFTFDKMQLGFGQFTQVEGNIMMKGLPDINNTYIKSNVKNSQIYPNDFTAFLSNPTAINLFQKFGLIRFDANFDGNINEFNASGKFNTGIGNAITNIHLNLLNKSYEGYLKATEFDVGKIADSDFIKKVTMDGKVKGKGFSESEVDITIDAHIDNIDINQYRYKDITVDGSFRRGFFLGKLLSNDENFNLKIDGEINLNKDLENPEVPKGKFYFNSQIEKIDLFPLNFATRPTLLKGDLELQVFGMNLDEIIGQGSWRDGYLQLGETRIPIQEVNLNAANNNNQRTLDINSDYVDLFFKGEFILSKFVEDLQELVAEIRLNFANDPEKVKKYYEEKPPKTENYELQYDITFKNINRLFDIFRVNAAISPNTRLNGIYRTGKRNLFKLSTPHPIDSVIYDGRGFYGVKLDLTSYKDSDAADIFAKLKLDSKKQDLGFIQTKDFSSIIRWKDDLIEFDTQVTQADTSNNFVRLEGNLTFNEDNYGIHLNEEKTQFRFLNQVWRIAKDNELNISQGTNHFKNVAFYHKNAQADSSLIIIDGVISDTIASPLNITIRDIDITPFSSIIQQPFGGVLGATIQLSDVYRNPDIDGRLILSGFSYNQDLLGDIKAHADWRIASNRLALDMDVFPANELISFIKVDGFYYPQNSEVDFTAIIEEMPLKEIEPFAKAIVDSLEGTTEGEFIITGTPDDLDIQGHIDIFNGKARMIFLNTFYQFADRIEFKKDRVTGYSYIGTAGNEIKITDEYGEEGQVKVDVYHSNFQNIVLDIYGKYKNFLVMNKPKDPSELFYGTAYATGDFSVKGPLNNLTLKADAENEPNTEVFLPLDGASTIEEEKDYITFVQPKDTTKKAELEEKQKVDLSGLKIELGVDINPDAKLQIIFDEAAGDIIQGSGKGHVDMFVDTRGEFQMLGGVEVTQGKYNFTLYNLINKEFSVKEGGTIKFNGDVFDTDLNLTAVYRVPRVSMSPLIDMSTVTNPGDPSYKLKYPVKVLLGLRGKLLEPDITLDIDMESAKNASNPEVQQAVNNLATRIQTDDQELNRQVLSLIVTQNFAPPNSLGTVGAGATSVEFLSNQLSSWLSQIDENLELSLDIYSSQVSFSYNLFNNRLRITRDGSFSGDQNQSNLAAAIGDWTVEYLISKDGKLRSKIYNRTNQGTVNLQNLNNAATTTAGFSLLYTQSFSRLSDLFKVDFSKKEKKKKKKDDE